MTGDYQDFGEQFKSKQNGGRHHTGLCPNKHVVCCVLSRQPVPGILTSNWLSVIKPCMWVSFCIDILFCFFNLIDLKIVLLKIFKQIFGVQRGWSSSNIWSHFHHKFIWPPLQKGHCCGVYIKDGCSYHNINHRSVLFHFEALILELWTPPTPLFGNRCDNIWTKSVGWLTLESFVFTHSSKVVDAPAVSSSLHKNRNQLIVVQSRVRKKYNWRIFVTQLRTYL